jgi:glycosyltransferase involved in cell wall biosynthesis
MITPFARPVLGGISTYLDGLSTELRKREDTVCVVVAEEGEGTGGSTHMRRSFPRFLAEGILTAFNLKPDVIHVHSNWRGLLIALIYRSLFRGTPVFFTFHTDSFSPLSGWKKGIFERMLRMCDTLIFVSSYLMSESKSLFAFDFVPRVIYPGVARPQTDETHVQRFIERFFLRDRFPILAYMTPFVWREKVMGIEILAMALRNLLGHSLSPRLVVIGEGPLRRETEARIKELGLDDIVVFTGQMSNPQIALLACDVYAHISMRESLGISILEAMSVGKPVIATDIGGIREIISEETVGELVSANPKDIERAILSLSQDRDRMNTIGVRAQEHVETKFTWRESADRHLRLYREGMGETENSRDG